jgi:hypothetical protein
MVYGVSGSFDLARRSKENLTALRERGETARVWLMRRHA